MTRPGIEPRSPGPLANTLTPRPMSGKKKYIYIYIYIYFFFFSDLERKKERKRHENKRIKKGKNNSEKMLETKTTK